MILVIYVINCDFSHSNHINQKNHSSDSYPSALNDSSRLPFQYACMRHAA
jgi:hypothetical protein